MTSHTPGQWAFAPSSGAIYADQGAGIETIIAGINQEHPSPEQSDADGRLMATAPEMLIALLALLAPHYDDDGVIDLESAPTIVGRDSLDRLQLKGSFIARLERARAAVLKAKGEAP